jgi:hypothetical protein
MCDRSRALPHPFSLSGDPASRWSATGVLEEAARAIAQYRQTLEADRREVRRYYFGDFARKVVGVGSVGTETRSSCC